MDTMSSAGAERRRQDERKARATRLVQEFYKRLSVGCGFTGCTSSYCRSSASFRPASNEDLAKVALELVRQKAKLCNPPPELMKPADKAEASTQQKAADASCSDAASSTHTDMMMEVDNPTHTGADTAEPAHTGAGVAAESMDLAGSLIPNVEGVTMVAVEESSGPGDRSEVPAFPPLELEEVQTLVAVFKESNDATLLHGRLSEVFSDWRVLSNSFCKRDNALLERSTMTQGETSDEPMDVADSRSSYDPAGGAEVMTSEDLETLRQSYCALNEIESGASVATVVADALCMLFTDLDGGVVLQNLDTKSYRDPLYLIRLALIVLEIPWLLEPAFLEDAMACIMKFCATLPKAYRIHLARHLANYSQDELLKMIDGVQQFFAFSIAMEGVEDGYMEPQDPQKHAVVTMEIFYAASILGGRSRISRSAAAAAAAGATAEETASTSSDAATHRSVADEPCTPTTMATYITIVGDEQRKTAARPKFQSIMDCLRKELQQCKEPLVPFERFVNEPLNNALDQQLDYINFQYNTYNFSVMRYPFLIGTAMKSGLLRMDCKVRQRLERGHIFHVGNIMYIAPYLKIQVRRDNIIQDTLTRLEIAAGDDPHSLQKQLFVEFEGEQGVDEGGVQKEFFQILIERLFNADFGMFVWDEETRLFWFNSVSFENEAHFSLIGMLLGLALYNNVILDIQFPMVVYRKLMGLEGIFDDLEESHPTVFSSLKQMLEYSGDDFVDVFDCTFCIGYEDVFGSALSYDLVPEGRTVHVTKDNRQEYVDRYTDFLLNTMISVQFEAFKKGFQTVTQRSNLTEWFHPDELELLVCGRKDLDFDAMEGSAEYDGYTKESPTIVNFWKTVHAFTEEQKRLLLQFCTGSDRVPLGGLKQLRFGIVRNGTDSNRLPTAHTCFNTLLLPQYKDAESLRERLLKAISHAKGFGMV